MSVFVNSNDGRIFVVSLYFREYVLFRYLYWFDVKGYV